MPSVGINPEISVEMAVAGYEHCVVVLPALQPQAIGAAEAGCQKTVAAQKAAAQKAAGFPVAPGVQPAARRRRAARVFRAAERPGGHRSRPLPLQEVSRRRAGVPGLLFIGAEVDQHARRHAGERRVQARLLRRGDRVPPPGAGSLGVRAFARLGRLSLRRGEGVRVVPRNTPPVGSAGGAAAEAAVSGRRAHPRARVVERHCAHATDGRQRYLGRRCASFTLSFVTARLLCRRVPDLGCAAPS